jgi:hypothetical protein
MPRKHSRAASKPTVKRSANRSAGAASLPSGAQDVTNDSADVLIGKIKLTCDDDTNVHFFRADGKLFMLSVERGGVSGTMPAEVV